MTAHGEPINAPEHTNALAGETSPYLIQHAHNPVDWRPWGPEAFEAARERDVPIFLSIGYSTCYWCHVMERESFEHEPTAALMNEKFVCVKVDREERPDVDDLYMAATVTMTGSGGWPMSVFLEPETLKPFFCGTYFPREPRSGMPTFTQVLGGMADAWADRRADVLAQADRLAGAVSEQLGAVGVPVAVGEPQITRAVQALLRVFDQANGGFGGAPKFPQPVFCELLLDVRDAADEDTRVAIDNAVRGTLDAMMIGGIHDHVGGGFHRYAVDQTWTVPHFEKMLYDNAQLLGLYARASVVYDDAQYARTARRTAEYVLREMSRGEQPGATGFFSAQDAEVDGREGLNYVWNEAQLREALDPGDAGFAISAFGLDRGTNFRDPHHPDDAPINVLRFDARPESVAERLGMGPDEFVTRLDAVCERLLGARDRRKQPRLDDKILTAWNGLMIEGLARAADALGEQRYAEAADHAARFLLEHHRDTGGTLLRSSRAGRAKTPAFLDDHAMLAAALLALASSSHTRHNGHRAEAVGLVEDAYHAFAGDRGVLYDTRENQPDLFVRSRSLHDGAVPSGQGVLLGVLIELAGGDDGTLFADRSAELLGSLSAAIAENPYGAVNAVRGLHRMLLRPQACARRIAFAPAGGAQPGREPSPVEVYASTDRVQVSDDEPAQFTVVLRIKPGFHIVAAEPGEVEGLVPLRVGLVSGQGIAVYADYPAGEPYGVESVGTINVHHGRPEAEGAAVEFMVAIERADGVGPSPGRPVLGLSFQACTDEACLAPTTVELDVAIDLQ